MLAVIAGVLVVVVGCMVAMALAFWLRADLAVPGLFDIRTSAEAGGVAVYLNPDEVGLALAALAVSAVGCFLATREIIRARRSGAVKR